MDSWNITASKDLLATLAKVSISKNQSNNFSAVNSAGFSSDYAKILSEKIAEMQNEFKAASENNFNQGINVETNMPVIETVKRFRPDGSIMITTYKDGSIDSTQKIKPHLVPMPDYSAPPTPEGNTDIKYVQRFTLAELLML